MLIMVIFLRNAMIHWRNAVVPYVRIVRFCHVTLKKIKLCTAQNSVILLSVAEEILRNVRFQGSIWF